jgi:hypothetical protein
MECKCYACGNDEPMGCGRLCVDCSWEDHLSHLAGTEEDYETPRNETPMCCLIEVESRRGQV